MNGATAVRLWMCQNKEVHAPERLFLDGEEVEWVENAGFIRRNLVHEKGVVTHAECTVVRNPIRIDWEYTVVGNDGRIHHFLQSQLEWA